MLASLLAVLSAGSKYSLETDPNESVSMDSAPPPPPFTALHSRPLSKDVWPPRGTALRGTTLGRHL